MAPVKRLIIILIIIGTIDFLTAERRPRQRVHEINCTNLSQSKKPFDIILDDDLNFESDYNSDPQPMEEIIDKVETNKEKIRFSLCGLKSKFERAIHLAEIGADTFNNDRLEQLDGTVTSRKVGSALRNTVLKVGECVSNVAKQVLVLPIRVKHEVPCVTKELLRLKNYSTDVANTITGALKSIVQYPRHMAICFKTEEKINCLAKLHKKVIKNTLADIMSVVDNSVQIEYTFLDMAEGGHMCPEYSQTLTKLSMIPLKLTQCINNKIY